jgi:hypothetical protein
MTFRDAMAEILLLAGVLALFGLALWLGVDSDDDNGGGGLMQPALVPIPVRPSR